MAAALSGVAAVFLWNTRRPGRDGGNERQVGTVIESQLEAIRAGDFALAFTFAAKSFHDRFDAETFGIMVRNGYPKLVESVSSTVLEFKRNGDQASVLMRIAGRRGPPAFFRYELVREDRGWRIAGVSEVDAPYITA